MLAESVIASVAESGAADGAAELAAIGRGYVRFAVGHPAHFEVMFRLDALNPDDPGFAAASEAAAHAGTGRQARTPAKGTSPSSGHG